jgi:sugar lactone lactonase YvrE
VAPDGSFVLVAESWTYRIRRLWLAGPKAGTDEVFSDNLPGFPDNINFTSRSTVWVALPSARAAQVDAMAPSPFMRKLIFRLPAFMQTAPTRYGLVVELGPDGEPLRSLHDPIGRIANITSVMELGDELFIGSHLEPSIAVVQTAARR